VQIPPDPTDKKARQALGSRVRLLAGFLELGRRLNLLFQRFRLADRLPEALLRVMRSIFARSRWARSIWPLFQRALVGFAMLRSCGEPIYRDLEYSSIQVYFSFLAYSRKA